MEQLQRVHLVTHRLRHLNILATLHSYKLRQLNTQGMPFTATLNRSPTGSTQQASSLKLRMPTFLADRIKLLVLTPLVLSRIISSKCTVQIKLIHQDPSLL
jgi:hypothetical protein